MKTKTYLGQRFGRLVTTCFIPGERARWQCVCDCGVRCKVAISSLLSGRTQACGCLQRERTSEVSRTHGHARPQTRTYRIWSGMKTRCLNPRSKHYKNYGARGVGICLRWMAFANFLADMGECPPGLTIERKNNNKGYYKRNCKWATISEQAFNRRPKTSQTF